MSKNDLEKTILVQIQKNKSKLTPIDIVQKISKQYDKETAIIENLLKDLVSKGKVSISASWKLTSNE